MNKITHFTKNAQVKIAVKRESPKSAFQQFRDQAHSLFHSFYFQVFVALLLLSNFGINAAEAQANP